MRCVLPVESEQWVPGLYPFLPPDSPEQERIIAAQAKLTPHVSALHQAAWRRQQAAKNLPTSGQVSS
jgi:hypothetical protein